jgi:hypothetical protein
MKVVDQLIRYLRASNALSPLELKRLIKKGFLAEEGNEEQADVVSAPGEGVDGLDVQQNRLEGLAGRKGKRPSTEPTTSMKRLWRTRLAEKRRARPQD